MADVTRRQFLRNASLGAAAAGVIAAGGAGLIEGIGGAAAATPLASAGASDHPAMEGSDVFAHVSNAKTGEITIFTGTKAVRYTNRDLAQQLLRASL